MYTKIVLFFSSFFFLSNLALAGKEYPKQAVNSLYLVLSTLLEHTRAEQNQNRTVGLEALSKHALEATMAAGSLYERALVAGFDPHIDQDDFYMRTILSEISEIKKQPYFQNKLTASVKQQFESEISAFISSSRETELPTVLNYVYPVPRADGSTSYGVIIDFCADGLNFLFIDQKTGNFTSKVVSKDIKPIEDHSEEVLDYRDYLRKNVDSNNSSSNKQRSLEEFRKAAHRLEAIDSRAVPLEKKQEGYDPTQVRKYAREVKERLGLLHTPARGWIYNVSFQEMLNHEMVEPESDNLESAIGRYERLLSKAMNLEDPKDRAYWISYYTELVSFLKIELMKNSLPH